MHANGTWVEFTAFREQDDGRVLHLDKATGVIVDGFVRQEDGALMYTVQHYEGNEPVPQPGMPARYRIGTRELVSSVLP